MWTSALTGAIPRCMGIGISHSPRDQAVTASRMRPMISPYARARCISASSRMRIKERLADARGFGKTYQPEILFLSFAPLVDFHLVAAGQPVGFIGHAGYRHEFGEHGVRHAGQDTAPRWAVLARTVHIQRQVSNNIISIAQSKTGGNTCTLSSFFQGGARLTLCCRSEERRV